MNSWKRILWELGLEPGLSLVWMRLLDIKYYEVFNKTSVIFKVERGIITKVIGEIASEIEDDMIGRKWDDFDGIRYRKICVVDGIIIEDFEGIE